MSEPAATQHLRREDKRLLTGAGTFVDDVQFGDMAHAAIFRSSWAHGRILNIDTTEAARLPGVIGVYTHSDLGFRLNPIRPRIAALPGFENFLQLPIATEKVRYVGEPIAVVVAEDPYVAEDAVALISADIEELPPVLNWNTAEAGIPLIHESAETNVSTIRVGRGNCEDAFKTAAYVRGESFTIHRHTAVPLEPRGLVACWDSKREVMTVFGITKVPFFNRTMLANMLGLPESQVVMKVGDAGGGFGVRGEFYPEDFLVPALAKSIGRPLKWIEDRREHFMATNHSRETSCRLEIACEKDGTIVGLRGNVTIDIGAYARGTGGTSPTRCAQFLPGPYRIPNFHCQVNVYVSNKTPSGTYRGPGRFEANFFRERLIDMAARDLAIDPAEIRLRNFVRKEEMPFDLGRLTTYEPPAKIDSGDYSALFNETLREIGWAEKKSIQGRNIDGWHHGIGFAAFMESSAGGQRERARISLTAKGTIDVYVGAASSGQGHETVFAQVCAETLNVSPDIIRITCASTDELSEGFGTWHSRSAVMSGNAVKQAAEAFLSRLRSLASEYFGRLNAELVWRDGRFWRANRSSSVDLPTLAKYGAERGLKIDLEETFEHAGLKPFSYGTHAAHVAVDARTGRVKILDFIAVEDIGRVLNPMIVHGQAVGAIVQGLGGTFMEHLVYDETGQLLTASFADYLVPTAPDFPNVRGKFMELARAPGNPLGAKGAGEGGIVAVPAAVANAVSAALSDFGIEIVDLPISPPRLWQLIHHSAKEAPETTKERGGYHA